jgi:hypothetical protein
MTLQVGDWVEVRSQKEILGTLDARGELDGLPFMPEMFQYCGRRFQIYRRAHKTCDTVNQTGGRRLLDCVHLETRCSGDAHGGCQAACLLFWKTRWLRPVPGKNADSDLEPALATASSSASGQCQERHVWAAVRVEEPDGPRYVCQATELPRYTTPLPWWHVGQYVEDYTAGNVTAGQWLRAAVYAVYFNVAQSGLGLGRPLRWFYDRFQSLWGGLPYPRRRGQLPLDAPTPTGSLDLQPGELVRIKSYEEILATLNTANKNRGLYFDAELVPFCGGTYRVKSRLTTFIDEKTGRMVTTKSPAILLEGVWCQARYSDCRMLCPRSIHSWWREIWLERVHPPAANTVDRWIPIALAEDAAAEGVCSSNG